MDVFKPPTETSSRWRFHVVSVLITALVKHSKKKCISRRFIFSPFRIPTMADDGEDLESICSNNGVPAHIFSGMLTAGWTIATLATGFKDASEFDDESALQDLGITDSLTRLERAAIKVVWTQCSKIFKDSQSSGSSQPRAEPTSPPPASTISTSEGGWHEAFPPKLGHNSSRHEEEIPETLSFRDPDTRFAPIKSFVSVSASDHFERILEMDTLEASIDAIT